MKNKLFPEFIKRTSPTFFTKAYRYFAYDGWIVGTTLKLNTDSTYELKSCSMIVNGNWTVEGDSLILTEVHKRFRIDSLNRSDKWKKYLNPNKRKETFEIDGNSIETVYKMSHGGKSLVKLIKSE
ncbi:hypothetical protein [Flavobacterium silvaticum]|uniref:Uncharacterized protein n=1 Tax=Flavobacterium silvaticum TaxID=1852020 RepID=A0A972FR94_9FLAO|nr:hypothetical protein [Flavobacterium silvaticum]NMH27904.1 hypothetical protein [Flavobacterium silvaticum]